MFLHEAMLLELSMGTQILQGIKVLLHRYVD
jgi:hypothetical protein